MKYSNVTTYYRCIVSFVLFFVSTGCVLANKDVDGYYITTHADTVNGKFRNYGNWDFSPGKIEFIKSGSTDEIILTPDNCSSLHIEGFDDYISFTGQRITNPASFSAALHESDTTIKYMPVRAFLRILFANEKFLLLEFKDRLRSNYYVQKKNEPTTELIFYRYNNDHSGSIEEYALFRNQLNGLLSDFIVDRPQVMDELQNLPYDDDELASFFSKVTGSDPRKQKTGKHSQFFITLGMNVTSVTNDNLNAKLPTSSLPFAGIGFIEYNRRKFGRSFFSVSVRMFRINASDGSTSYFRSWIPGLYMSPGYYIIHKERVSWYASLLVGGMISFSQYLVPGGRGYPTVKVDKDKRENFVVAPETGITFNRKFDLFVNYYLYPKYNAVYRFRSSIGNIGINYKLHK